MSKELEALEDIILYLNASEPKGLYCENIETIQQALLELQSIKEAKPSEALEAFGRITLHTEYDNDSHYDGLHFEDDCKLVDKALERLEQIDNANTSEALKELEGIEYVADVLKVNHKIGSRDIANQEIKEMVDRLNYRIPTIKKALLKAQKEHKAFEIIKKKNVSVAMFKICGTVERYNTIAFDEEHFKGKDYSIKLTQEEFNLLKEVLE